VVDSGIHVVTVRHVGLECRRLATDRSHLVSDRLHLLFVDVHARDVGAVVRQP
jgi:hypothetical protein